MNERLQSVNNSSKQVIVLGDTNINFLQYCNDNRTSDYLDMLLDSGFMSIITKATRITDHSKTLIDHIYTNISQKVLKSGICLVGLSSPMKKAVTLKALKNKDRMSVETAVEVLSPEVQRAIPTDDVVTIIVPEIYTFWRQNRPGILAYPVDAAVHQPTGTIFFSDQFTHQIMMSDLHCPATLSSIAGANSSGLSDGRNSLFQNPSGLCIFANLIFVCDSGNASIRIIDISRLVSKKKNDTLFYEASESEDQDDSIPIARKYAITCSLSLISTISLQLQRPFSICTGRKLLQDYPDFYVGDTTRDGF